MLAKFFAVFWGWADYRPKDRSNAHGRMTRRTVLLRPPELLCSIPAREKEKDSDHLWAEVQVALCNCAIDSGRKIDGVQLNI